MKLGAKIISGLTVALLFSIAASADDLAISGNPYSRIVERNAFDLVPIPVVTQTDPGPPPVPPPAITPNGIMSVFGKYQVLFKVALPPQGGQPASVASHMMSEGEREDDIEVVKIDYGARMITFNNHGVVQELPLETAKNVTSPATAAVGAVAGSPAARSALAARRAAAQADSEPGVVVVANPPPAAAPNPNSGFATMSGDSSVNTAKTTKPRPETITPEQQIISMEAQRAKWLDEGNPAAAIVPPTPLTAEVTGQTDQNGGAPAPHP